MDNNIPEFPKTPIIVWVLLIIVVILAVMTVIASFWGSRDLEGFQNFLKENLPLLYNFFFKK